MKRIAIPAIIAITSSCVPQPQVAPQPEFTRIDNAFIISRGTYHSKDTLALFIDKETCEPDRVVFLWRREGDTLTALLVHRSQDIAQAADVYEPVHLHQGILNLYNEHPLTIDKVAIEKKIQNAQIICVRHDEQYRARVLGERQS